MITKEYLQQELAKRIDGYKRGVETTTDNIIAEMKSILTLVDALPDYEKKYNEALERFMAFKEKYYTKNTVIGDAIFDKTGEMQRDFESIFSEHRESEDERIRKALVWHLKAGEDFVSNGVTKEECITYLEKQKYDRMKPIYDARESFESALGKAWNDYHNGYENVDKLEDDYVECAHAKGFREGYLFGIEKQKEQKPAEWSEEDERIMQTMIKEGDLKPSEIAWLKSLRPSWKPSEEQIDALKELIDDANRAGWVTPGATELYEQLKKL